MVSSRTNNGNAQISGSQLNVKSSSAKIRVPDPLLVLNELEMFKEILHYFIASTLNNQFYADF